MESPIYNQEGKKVETFVLPENIFGLSWNADLVHQVVTSLSSSKRSNVAHTKDRGEVRGGGRKPWRQKGTGRARHGSSRSPIWVGGGVTHGPRNEKDYERKVPKNMRIKALHTILSRKYRDGELLLVDSITLSTSKTKEAIKIVNSLSRAKGFENLFSKKNNAALLALGKKSIETEKSFRNLSNLKVIETRNLDPLSLLEYKYLVLENPTVSLKNIPGNAGGKVEKVEKKPMKASKKSLKK